MTDLTRRNFGLSPADAPTESVEAARSDLASHAAVGVFWTVAQKWVVKVTGLVTVIVLTRLLSPTDFGIVAVALTLLPLVQMLADMGFSTYLVQTEENSERTYSTAFWYSATAGVMLGGGLLLLAPLLADMLKAPDVAAVIRGLAPAALLVTLGSVPIAQLRRRMRFRALAVQGVVAAALGQVVAIMMALLGFGVWALVAQTLVFQAVATTLAWISAGWHPSFTFSWAALRDMAQFGFKVVGVEVVAMSRLWLENAIVVAALGLAGLGYLSIAQRLVQMAQDLTTSALAPVSVVVFSKVRESLDRLRSAYLRAVQVSLVLVVPIMVFLAVAAPALLPLVFGPQWGESVLPAQAYAVAGVFTLGVLDQGLFYGLGKPGTFLSYALVVDVLTVLVTLVAVSHGLTAVALGFLGVACVATLIRYVLIGRHLSCAWWRIATPLARVAAPAACAAAAGWGVALLMRGLPPIAAVAAIGITVLAAYLPLVRLTLPHTWAEFRRMARSMSHRLSSRRWRMA